MTAIPPLQQRSNPLCAALSITMKNGSKQYPQEVIDCDYGCGDPSKYVREGETVNGIEFRSMTVIACKADAQGNTDSGPIVEQTNDCCSDSSCC